MNFSVNLASEFVDCRKDLPRHATPGTSQEPAEIMPRTCREPAESLPRTSRQTPTAKPWSSICLPQNDEPHHKRRTAKLGDGGCRAAWRLRIHIRRRDVEGRCVKRQRCQRQQVDVKTFSFWDPFASLWFPFGSTFVYFDAILVPFWIL